VVKQYPQSYVENPMPIHRLWHDFHLQWDSKVFAPHGLLQFGHHVGINSHCTINTDMICGNHILVGDNVGFLARDSHIYREVGTSVWDSPHGDQHKIVIEDDVWIGYGAIVLSGVTIGRCSIIAAGAIVIEDVPPYSILVPERSRVLRQRFTPEQIVLHEQKLRDEGIISMATKFDAVKKGNA
jgi:acetyltransferase-like isoleucine patch superfamily enzyme